MVMLIIPVAAKEIEYIFTASDCTLIVDGQEYSNPDIEIPLYNKDGFNYAPLAVIRDLCMRLGIGFEFDSATKEIKIDTALPDNESEAIKDFLIDNYNHIDTIIDYTVIEDFEITKEADTYIVKIKDDYLFYNDIQFGQYEVKYKEQATSEIEKYMENLYSVLINNYPDSSFQAYISCDFTNIHNIQQNYRLFSWYGNKTQFNWQTQFDNEWVMSIPEAKYIKNPKYLN